MEIKDIEKDIDQIKETPTHVENKTSDFFKTETLKTENILFRGKIISTLIGYIGITLWLNAIRATASLWFVWVLIVIQFLLYSSIFSFSYTRASVIGLNKSFGFLFFVTLAILGRVNNWELFIIPLLLVVMFIFSAKNNNVSDKRQDLLWVFIFGSILISFLFLPRFYFYLFTYICFGSIEWLHQINIGNYTAWEKFLYLIEIILLGIFGTLFLRH
jgi:hypothetical protein